MDCITFNMAGMHRHGTAFYDFLRLRKSFFVDQLGWDLPHDDEVEMDQYDNPKAWYALVRGDEGQIVGGARAMPTTARWGEHSWMMGDALEGKLTHIPAAALDGINFAKGSWEITRIVISDALDTQADRQRCLLLIAAGVEDVAIRHGASEVVGLTHPSMVRALRAVGLPAERRGAAYECVEDGRSYGVLSIPVRRYSERPRGGVASAHLPPPMPTHGAQPMMVHAPQKD